MHFVPGGSWGQGAAVALLFGMIFAFTAHDDAAILEGSTADPLVIAVSELEKGANGANRHVTVTDFVFGRRHVIEEKDGRWNVVWIPIHPSTGGPARTVDVVVRSFRIQDQAALRGLYARTSITGILIGGLSSEAEEALRKAYPGLDRTRVRVLSEGRSFPSRRFVEVSRTVGFTLLGIALLCAFRAWWGRGERQAEVYDEVEEEVAEQRATIPETPPADPATPRSRRAIRDDARGQRFALGMLLGGLAAGAFFIAGTVRSWNMMMRLERDDVQAASLFGPVELLYRAGGPWAGIVPGILATVVALIVAGLGALLLWRMRGYIVNRYI